MAAGELQRGRDIGLASPRVSVGAGAETQQFGVVKVQFLQLSAAIAFRWLRARSGGLAATNSRSTNAPKWMAFKPSALRVSKRVVMFAT